MRSNKTIFWIIAFIIVGMIALIFLNQASKNSVTLDVTGQPFVGDENAPVKIVEFGDYKCPACKSFNELLYPQIEEEFVNTGKAAFYFINYSFINVDSHRAAQFAETVYQELGNDAFWKFHDLLFQAVPDDGVSEYLDVLTEDVMKDLLLQIATEEETERVMQAFAENKGKEAWEKDLSIARSLQIQGTPSLFINGQEFTGSSWSEFVEMVEKAAK